MNEFEEQLAQEDALFPWLADNSMADPATEVDFFDDLNEFEDEEDFD
jgi:hypothetical protein